MGMGNISLKNFIGIGQKKNVVEHLEHSKSFNDIFLSTSRCILVHFYDEFTNFTSISQ